MLSGKGYEQVYNLAGGIKAWNSEVAYGEEDFALELFSGDESAEKVLAVAYSLEHGLRDFYLSMIKKVISEEVKKIFSLLADVEVKHQERIFQFFKQINATNMSKEDFAQTIVVEVIEGGLTTDEYVTRFQPAWNSVTDVVAIAMSIEAQALDLYQRAARKSNDPEGKKFLTHIAAEEKAHLSMLGQLIDNS